MQKQKLRNNKIKGRMTKRINAKNLPIFILIGLIAMIIIIAVIYYVFLRYSPEQIITYKGYAIEGKTMAESLKSSEISSIEPYLNLIEVKENDLLYKRLNSFYIGEGDKKEIDINYPMYINEGNTLLNISRNTKLITVNYEEVEGYPEFMLTGGVMYNGVDLTRADGNKYIFLKSEDEIYTNVDKIKIKTASNDYEIKEFSNIYFTENAITYYEMQDGYMQYKRIADIDNNSEIEVNGETLTYKVFLEKLGIIQSEENVNNNDNENTLDEIIENNIVEENQEENNNSNNLIDNDMTNEWQEGMWAKPEVSCTDFESDVYTIRTNLEVIDRAGVITRGVIFEISLDGRLNRRVQATKTGKLEITGLQPDTEYEIVGIVYYNDENGVEQEEEFYTGKVTTKSIDTLGTIDFSFQNGTIYPNKIELIHFKINNDINEEVIKGISRLQLEIDGIEYRLSNDEVTQIKSGEEITYNTSETIKSNSKIKYEITAFDKFGNELKEINNTGETITSKQLPSASIRATKQDVTEVDLEVTLTNKDKVTLENYRYEIVNQSSEVVKTGDLSTNKEKETLVFTDLDPNGYYQIVIYGDYDLENGEGRHEKQELGRGSFVTRPIASLGYITVNIDDKEVTQNEIKLGVGIDENQTDARLIAILDKVEIIVYDEGKNINQGNSEETDEQSREAENEIKRINLTDEEVKQLKTAEEIELNLDQLNSNTIYKIDVITTVKQGSVEEVVEDKQNLEQVITLKMPAEVQIRNQFVIGDMIDLDIRVEDVDNAVLTNSVRIEVRDEENKLVNLSEMQTNADYERKVYEDLEPETTYRIIVYAPQYNEGSTDETYHADYILKEIEIYTEAGISGKLDLLSLEKTPSGKNLIDVSSKVNWYERCFATGYKYGLDYDESTKILTLGGTNGSNRINCYDLIEYLGKEITISFKARTQDNTNMQIIEKNSYDMTYDERTVYKTIDNLSEEWREYSCTLTLEKTGYIGFYINKANESVEIKDLQIELGNIQTDYEDFEYIYNANLGISINDARDEITTNDYYIRIYKNGEQIEEIRYEEIGEDNKVENVIKSFNVDTDATYKIELLAKIADRYYELDSQEFSTEGAKEIKGISELNDFLKIQPYGEYIVLNDIDLSGGSSAQYRFGYTDLQFQGKIDFNGNTLTRDLKNNNNSIFHTIGDKGTIENLVFDLKLNNEIGKTLMGGLTDENNGTIKNIQINLVDSLKQENTHIYLLVNNNYGVIENFILNFQKNFYVYLMGAMLQNNYGTIKNGYVFGKNIKVLNNSEDLNADMGVISRQNNNNGLIENIFTLVNIDSNKENDKVTNFLCYNNNTAIVRNAYSVGIGNNITDFSRGPNIYSKSSKNVYNTYYFTDEVFTSELETKGNELSLWDSEFQNQLLNSDNAFIIDDLVSEGYYPQLNMPDVMPLQEYIELPEVEDADLPDILSTKIIEQGTNIVKVEFSVNNPSSETISNIQIENLDVEILSQEYKNGKSTVVAELKNPIICVSSYNVLSISTRGAFNSSYTREYEEGERVINVDLYKEIWNVNDWISINDSPTENYMLMSDLDFINEGSNISITSIQGILNGNGHTISNITNVLFINRVYGTIENLYIRNYVLKTANSASGLFTNVQTGAIIDNVHLDGGSINQVTSGYVGGIVRYGTQFTIRNSSVRNLTISVDIDFTPDELYLGGLAGYINNSTIENCFVTGIIITDVKGVNSAIGGLVGTSAGINNISNCYAEGRIKSDNINVGGIIGKLLSGKVENCYSKVNISSTNNNIGGIVGIYGESDASDISNNLSIGNIYTTSGVNNLSRIVGNNLNTSNTNYAYEKQLLNGYINNEEKGATLLNCEEIMNLNLGEAYNYDGQDNEILPKLYNIEGTELLPNQENIYLDDNTTATVILEIESIEATKPNTTEAEIDIRINNPKEVEITGIEIEDMTSEVTRNVTQNGITSITVRSIPERYYDSYKLTEIRYKTNQLQEEQIKEVEVEIEVQFYKELYTYEDWQSIEEGTYQNYRLMNDIDFNSRENVRSNITVNRLEAENNIYTLKNITLEFNEANKGLINNVKTSIRNIEFENITIINTASSGNYCGIISTNNGKLDNLQFKDITIDAEGLNYVGIIGGELFGDIENINISNINIEGANYVGGLTGVSDVETNTILADIEGDNVTIKSNGMYIGGLIGRHDGSEMTANNFSIENSNIEGGVYVGGILGYAYRGTLNYLKTENSNITGESYIGGIVGYSYYNTRIYLQTSSSTVNGSGDKIGGVFGHAYGGGSTENFYVNDTIINATSINSRNIGGIVGLGQAINLYDFQIVDVKINSNGKNIGGIGNGYDNSVFSARRGYLENVFIQGNNNVGGVFGYTSYGTASELYVNVNISAYSNTAGSIIGFMENSNMTTAMNTISICDTEVLNTSITAQSKAGGLIGDIAVYIYRDQSFYYNNYVDADVISENESTGSLIIGGRPDENEYITNTYVYKYSKLNGDYVYTTNDMIDSSQYLVRDDLDVQSTFQSKIGLGTTYFDYASLQEEKYPTIKAQYLYYPELQTGIDLPTDPEIVDLNNLDNEENHDKESNENSILTQSIEALPGVVVYPISVNEINVDFSNISDGISFTYYINGSEIETTYLTEKTYTFKYNFIDELKIVVSNGVEEETTTINPSDIKSEISLDGDNNAYLIGTKLYINGEVVSGEYVNIYSGYALNSSGQVLDVTSGEVVENGTVETYLEETAKPLHVYEYKGSSIETFGTYSKIDGNIKLQIYNVRSGKLSAISNNLDIKIDNFIVDNYNNKEYQTILTKSGEIVDLKEQLQYPVNFLSRNIKQIVQNSSVENTEMMVLYNTGKVIVFNYVNGNILYENDEKADNGLTNYITGSLSSIWSDYENKQSEYLKSKDLVAKLVEMPVEEAIENVNNNQNSNSNENSTTNAVIENTDINTNTEINNTNSINNNSYITVYNGETGEYEVYSESEILEGTEENPMSETEKIKENGLESVYNYDKEQESGSKINGAVIVILIIILIIISLVILRVIVSKRKNNN